MAEKQLPSYLLDSERELFNIDGKNSKLSELKKQGDPNEAFPYLNDIPQEYLNDPSKLNSTGTELRYLYNDKDFDLKSKVIDKDFTYTPEKIDEIYKKKCNTNDEKIKDIKKIIAIGDIHGDYKQLIYILKKYNIIKKTTKPYKITIHLNPTDKEVSIREIYKNEQIKDKEFEFDYELNVGGIDNIIIIQVGDQLTGYREANLKSYDLTNFNYKEDEKVLIFMDILREQAEQANKSGKNIHIKSLIGNHEFTNLRGIYSKCSEKDSSCIDYYTPQELRVDRRAFIKNQLTNILCNRDYFFAYNGIVFAHSGIVNSVLVRLNTMFPHLNIIKNLESLGTLEEKINYYNKLVKTLIYIKVNSIKDDDIKLKTVPVVKDGKEVLNEKGQPKTRDIFNSIDEKLFADLANSKAAINDLKTGMNTLSNYNLFHLSYMVVGHDMVYNGIEKTIYIIENNNVIRIYKIVDGDTKIYEKNKDGKFIEIKQVKSDDDKDKVITYNIDTGSNSFVGINEETLKPDFTFKDRLTGKTINPASKNQLLKQVLLIDIDDKGNMTFSYDTTEKINTQQPYVSKNVFISSSINPDLTGYDIYGDK